MNKLWEMMNQIRGLGAQIRRKSEEVQKMAAEEHPDFAALEKAQAEMGELVKRQQALKDAYQMEETAAAGRIGGNDNDNRNREERTMSQIRKSNEYTQAWAYALRNGLNFRTGRNDEQCKPLYDALTETGGTPTGVDGGFLVPEDVDNRIIELKRDFGPLAPLFGTEEVTAPTGWRVVDTKPTKGMAEVEEMGSISNSEQPSFAKVPYSVKKYADILPVSNELLQDNVANLMEYVARWFARKATMTENGQILAALAADVTPTAIGTGKPLSLLKTLLNKTLDPAISRNAVIICNQNGFDLLDQLEDGNNRPLLQPDPVNPTQYKVFGRSVHVFSNAVMTGSVIYAGDGRQFGTRFVRQGFELASTDIGGNAWKTDSTEIRGIMRVGFTTFDAEAMAGLSF